MESLHSQQDVGMRTADFFDDSSEDEHRHATVSGDLVPEVEGIDARLTDKRKRRTASSTEPFLASNQDNYDRVAIDEHGYQPLNATAEQHVPHPMADTASSSFNGSIGELLRSSHRSSRPPQLAEEERGPTATEHITDQRHVSMPVSKVDPTLGAYAIAHEITLNALMRDGDALDRSLQSFALAPLQPPHRQSTLPQTLDPRSPRHRNFSTPATATTKKSVHVVPPPIDTGVPRRSMPADIVRTPYPFSPETVRHQDFGSLASPPTNASISASSTESVLTVSIRRHNPNSRLRITTVTIPASNHFTAVRSSSIGAKERHFKALDFDDAEFFRRLRRCYSELSGPLRFLSARTLSRIAISGAASRAADLGYGWRSPRMLAYKGLNDTFSEEQILRHYRNPSLGRSRYAFIHWAHRLASTSMPRTPRPDRSPSEAEVKSSISGKEEPEGLEYVVTWSVTRIAVVLALVLAISIAAALLWIFLGRNTTAEWPARGGFRDAGDRVGSGVLIGICLMLLGLSSMAGWLGMSWLVM